MLKYWIFSLALFYLIIFVNATDSAEDCDEDDLECLEDFTTATSSTFVTSSSSSFGEPSSTVSAAGTPDVLSDFHEAKLVKPKPNPNNPGGRERLPAKEDGEQAGSVQDKYNQDQDIDSGSAGLGDSIDESTATGLSKVEAGVLSACGILVVAGIAVGIFVWKNTTNRRNLRNQDMSMADLEHNHDLDTNGGDPMAVKNSIVQMPIAILDPPIKSQRQNDDIQSLRSTTTNNSESLAIIQKQLQQELDEEERLQLEQLKQQTIINLTLPALERDEDDFFASWEQRNSKPIFQSEPTQQIPEQASFQLPKFEHTLFTSEETEPVISVQKSKAVEIVYDESEEADEIQPNSIAAANVDLVSSTYHTPEVGKEYEMENLSPGLQANTAPRPSALDPAYDPTAITYPLQKFLNTPTHSFKSPVQIPVELEDDDQQDDQDNTMDDQSNQPLDTKQDAFGAIYTEKATSAANLGQQLNKIFRQPDHFKSIDNSQDVASLSPTQSVPMVDIDLHESTSKPKASRVPLSEIENRADELANETEPGKQPFLSPLDLPDDQYIPMRGAAGPPLVSRAQVLADPVRRLGEDEIALWENNCRKKELKRLSYEMWDEQMLREEIEQNDRKNIASYYGEQATEQEEKAIP